MSIGGWLPQHTGTPYRMDVGSLLDSDRKLDSKYEDFAVELQTRKLKNFLIHTFSLVHAELKSALLSMDADDWQFRKPIYTIN